MGVFSPIYSVDTLVFASSFLAFVFWGALTLLHGKMIVPISFGFGLSSAGIFALASVVVTKRYEKEKWESYIALMQAFMTGGTVMELLITSVYASPIIAVPLLAVAFISYIPLMHPSLSTIKTHKQIRLSKSPISYLVRLFGRYSHRHIRLSRMKIKTRINKAIAILDLRWTVALLAVAPVYAIYPLLMKDLFCIDHRLCSLIYAISTAMGVYLFIVAGKLAKQKNSTYPFNISTLLYFLTFVLMGAGYLLKNATFGRNRIHADDIRLVLYLCRYEYICG